jgi:arylsulfatase A-like enzyme
MLRFSSLCLVLAGVLTQGLALLGSTAQALASSLPTQHSRPNIVLILADDVGWNDVGFHGSEIRTPHIDALAAAGIQLERFYVKAVCTPTRAALMTGRHPFRYGMSDGAISPPNKQGLPLEETTIAEILQTYGYYTAILGKWHLGHYQVDFLPTSRGFAHHYGHYGGAVDYFDHTHERYGGLDWHRNQELVSEEGYTTHLLGDEALRLIKNHDFGQAPLFLYMAFNAAHTPLQAPQNWLAEYPEIEDEERRIFAAQVSAMDAEIGRIVKALQQQQVYDNTLIVFTSDNGASLYRGATSGDNRPLRGYKHTLYDGGLRVPTVISYPAKLPQGKIVDDFFQVVDLFPTFMNLAQEESPQNLALKGALPQAGFADLNLDGIDLMQVLLQGPNQGSSQRDLLLLHHLDASRTALISGQYKLVINGMGKLLPRPLSYNTIELFDIVADPSETHNLIYKYPAKAQEIQEAVQNYTQQAPPSITSANPATPRLPDSIIPPSSWTPEVLQELEQQEASAANLSLAKKIGKTIQASPRRWILALGVGLGIGMGYGGSVLMVKRSQNLHP